MPVDRIAPVMGMRMGMNTMGTIIINTITRMIIMIPAVAGMSIPIPTNITNIPTAS